MATASTPDQPTTAPKAEAADPEIRSHADWIARAKASLPLPVGKHAAEEAAK